MTAVATADPVKSVTSAYDGFSVSITDAQNCTKSQTLNAAGQVIKVIDEMGTHMGITHDPAGNRIQVTNAVGTPKQNSVSTPTTAWAGCSPRMTLITVFILIPTMSWGRNSVRSHLKWRLPAKVSPTSTTCWAG